MNAPAIIEHRAAAVPETKQGRHRSATFKGLHMFDTSFVPIREGVVMLDGAQARAVLEHHAYEHNRDWTKAMKHVDVLAEQMRRGQWLDRSQIDFVSLPDGKLILVNGHHRMAAQAKANVTIRWQVVIRPCATMDDVASVYARHDTNLRARSEENIIDALNLASACGVRPTTARALWRAAPIIANGMRTGRKDDDFLSRSIADDRLKIAMAYAQEARMFEAAMSRAAVKIKDRVIRSGGVSAVALVTFRANVAVAQSFWGGLAENDGLRRADPRATYRDWLLNMGGKASAAPYIFATTKAWNYFHDGDSLSIIKMTGSPIRIAGTSYTVAL